MKRREFIALAGSATAWSLSAAAQPSNSNLTVGVLIGGPEDAEGRKRVTAFRQGLNARRWVEGVNTRVVVRWAAGNVERMRTYSAELAATSPDVLLGSSTPVIAILRQEAGSTPIVFISVSDPVGSGFVNSFHQPGGNITGFASFEYSMGGKWLELLKEIFPSLVEVSILFNPKTTPGGGPFYTRPVHAVATSLGIRSIEAPIHTAAEIEPTLAAMRNNVGTGLIVIPEAFTVSHSEAIVATANRFRLPAVYPWRVFADHGGIISYGIDIVEDFRAAAGYVDRIKKGEKPGVLPVQQPTKFELVINLKAAKALGLTVPANLLARADDVIE